MRGVRLGRRSGRDGARPSIPAGLLIGVALSFCPATRGAPAQDPLPHASLGDLVAELKRGMPRAGSGGFVPPSEDELDRFAGCVRALLDGDVDRAAEGARTVGCELRTLDDRKAERTYFVLAESPSESPAAARGQGIAIVDPDPLRNLVLAVPHPLYDIDTPEVGVRIFQELRARALIIAGAHRCASAERSPCSGRTEACGGGAYRISDAAHFPRTFLQAAHRALIGLDPRPVAVSLHGMVSRSADAILSDGTVSPSGPDALVNRLRAGLRSRGVRAASCNWPADGEQALCGTTNVQGRLYNGSADPCTEAARASCGLFLHVEQARTLRKEPAPLVEAFREVIPAPTERRPPG